MRAFKRIQFTSILKNMVAAISRDAERGAAELIVHGRGMPFTRVSVMVVGEFVHGAADERRGFKRRQQRAVEACSYGRRAKVRCEPCEQPARPIATAFLIEFGADLLSPPIADRGGRHVEEARDFCGCKIMLHARIIRAKARGGDRSALYLISGF